MSTRTWKKMVCAGAVTLAGLTVTQANAYDPYTGSTPLPIGPDGFLPLPVEVSGKELSLTRDQTTTPGPLLSFDPEQNLLWDGRTPLPGLIDGFDYSFSRPGPTGEDRDREVDALGARSDLFFRELNEDRAHLIYSTAPGRAAKPASSALALFGVGPLPENIEYEMIGGPPDHGLWADHTVDINSDTDAPSNVDGLEVYGPDHSDNFPGGDASHYSLDDDILTPGAFSVWYYDAFTSTSTGVVPHSEIVTAVTSLLGPIPTGADLDVNQIDVDALMVRNEGPADEFEAGDAIYFSIEQLVDPSDADGFYATGSEIFLLEIPAAGAVPVASFLTHAGHKWDHAWTLDHMTYFDEFQGEWLQLDVDAIEAVSAVPEPTAVALLGLGGLALLRRRR